MTQNNVASGTSQRISSEVNASALVCCRIRVGGGGGARAGMPYISGATFLLRQQSDILRTSEFNLSEIYFPPCTPPPDSVRDNLIYLH